MKRTIEIIACDRCGREMPESSGAPVEILVDDESVGGLVDICEKCQPIVETKIRELLLRAGRDYDGKSDDGDDANDAKATEPAPAVEPDTAPASKPDPKPAAKPKAPKKKEPELPTCACSFGLGDIVEHTDANGDHHRGEVLSRFPGVDGEPPTYEVKLAELGALTLSEAELVEAGTGALPVDDDEQAAHEADVADEPSDPTNDDDPLDDTVGEMPSQETPAPAASDDDDDDGGKPDPADLPPVGDNADMPF